MSDPDAAAEAKVLAAEEMAIEMFVSISDMSHQTQLEPSVYGAFSFHTLFSTF